nr:hypothetical protein [Hepelivirales sp.]
MNVSETAAGKAWLEKYLHPPSVQKPSFVATPDNNISPVTTLNFETVNNIPLTATIGTGPSSRTLNFTDVFFLQTTGARVVSYVFVRSPGYNSGNWFQHPQTPAITNDSYDFVNNWGSDVSMQRLSYKSCTYYLNATAFNDQGTVTIAQARPAVFVYQGTHPPPIDVSQRVEGEFDYNCQILDVGDVSGSGQSGEFVPSTPTQVQQSNPKAVTHLAREGAFVPQHWSQPTNRFWNNADTGNGSDHDLVQTYIRFTMADKSEHTVRLFNKMNADGSIPDEGQVTLDNAADTPWCDFTVAYVYFSALSVSPVLGQTIVSQPYITVKSIYGVEVQPFPKSSFTFFQQTPPIPDDRAIHIAAGIVHQKPDGYPSSANDLGSIFGLVTKFAPKVFNWLTNAFNANSPKEKKVKEKKERVDTKEVKQLAKAVARTEITPRLRRRPPPPPPPVPPRMPMNRPHVNRRIPPEQFVNVPRRNQRSRIPVRSQQQRQLMHSFGPNNRADQMNYVFSGSPLLQRPRFSKRL